MPFWDDDDRPRTTPFNHPHRPPRAPTRSPSAPVKKRPKEAGSPLIGDPQDPLHPRIPGRRKGF